MSKHLVNLDALILREDLEIQSPDSERPGGDVPSISIVELEESRSMFDVLRKPDFQRETSEWKPDQIVELVRNVLDEELVPAVIVWKAPNRNVFVIDGAHRLSALIAWVNDDYGDGHISLKFYGGIDALPKAQLEAAKETRRLINESIGSYRSLGKFRKDESGGTPEQIRRGKNIASAYIFAQSVRNDAAHAEASFYRINQGGAVINDTEKEIIHSRRRPEALAARSLLRAGTGHQYWSAFKPGIKEEIESLAKSVYETLYRPDLEEPIRTMELPMAGKGYSADALAVLYQFIHIANKLTRTRQNTNKQAVKPLPSEDPKRDPDGIQTIKYLKVVKRLSELISSNSSGSLGLHPAVYSYSATGRFQPTAFFAQVQLVQELEEKKRLLQFTEIRAQFEDFLVDHKHFINQLIRSYGSNTRGLGPLRDLYILIINTLLEGKTNSEIKNAVLRDSRFENRLTEDTAGQRQPGKRFSKETKAAIRLREALKTAPRCGICNARYHPNSTTIDHIDRKQDGGLGSLENGAVTHPFCNNGYKEWRHSQGNPLDNAMVDPQDTQSN